MKKNEVEQYLCDMIEFIDQSIVNKKLSNMQIDFHEISPMMETNNNSELAIQDEILTHLSLYNIHSCQTLPCFILPQSISKEIKSDISFEQRWSPQVSVTKLIGLKKAKKNSSILWSLIIRTLFAIHSNAKRFQYDILLFGICYFCVIFYKMNIDFFVNFVLFFTWMITTFMVIYEKWISRYVIRNECEHHSWRRMILAVCGLLIGTITT
ncbi:hypothetical protein I4U23_015029 [Adineta vaga]|nr:hypothetical protein I4U23_015029 [Adineta vaga]